MSAWRLLAAMIAGLSLGAACGGGGGGTQGSPTYTIGGTVNGLSGGGLVLRLNGGVASNGGSDLSVSAGASSFTFSGKYDEGQQYFVEVKTQPSAPTQVCSLANQNGTVGNASATNIAVTCTTSSYPLGGGITGYTGTGLTLKLNDGAPQTIASGAIAFTFGEIPSGTNYAVTVGTQPTSPAQTCAVTNGTGTVGAAAVTNVSVACVTVSYTVGGAVAGLTGTGLVLRNNGGNDLSVPANATSFTFPTPVNAGGAYNVTVKTQPGSPTQTCTVANGTGNATANITNVVVNCVTNSYTIGGTVSGLSGSGLSLLLNGASPLAVPAGATTFTFPGAFAPGADFTVTVAVHPTGPAQTCTITNGTGTVGNGNVTTVAINCSNNAANTWTVGGSINGLTNAGLVLQLNGGSPLTVAAGATAFAFAAVPAGTSYAVTVGTQPTGQTCNVTNGSGTVGSANVTNVAVNCTVNRYTIGGTITGLVGTGLSLTMNGGARVNPAAGATTFTFLGNYPTGTAYTAVVSIQPSNPTQSCTITNATGTVGLANVTNIAITCVTVYTIGGTITNQIANGLVLLLNGGSPLARNVGQPNFAFSGVPAGTPYTVTVGTQPSAPSQVCSVDSGGSGTVGAANVTNVVVVCRTFGQTVGGNITGYTGTGLTLRINGGPPLTPQANFKFTFPDFYSVGQEFGVTIASQPTGPAQTCTLIRGAGKVPAPPASAANISVQCTTNATSPLSGTYSILVGGKRNYLTLWPDGTYAFAARSDDPSCGASSGNGVEYGVYNWNATTHAFAILTAAIDTDEGCGVWDPTTTPQEGLQGTLVKAGNTLTITTTDGTYVLTAVDSPLSTIVGSWVGPDGNDGAFVVLQPDNTFLFVQTQANGVGGGGLRVGYERGCYTATGSTLTFTLAAGCTPDGFPPLDLNGEAGVSPSSVGVAIPFVITGPNTATIGGDTFLLRLLPN